ncbi:MAG: C13 family peptidase [Arenicellales bacterium]
MNKINIFSTLLTLMLGALLFYIAGSIFYKTPILQIAEDARLPDGSRYYGEMSNGLFNGKGTLVWDTGDEYTGNFKDGLFSGVGTFEFRDGTIYTGEFQSGVMQGQGEYIDTDGTVYKGEFINDDFTGNGEIINKESGYTYKGEVKEWIEHGNGQYKIEDGSIYEGAFIDGSFTGEGVYIDDKKNIYTGTFKDWLQQGDGSYLGADGNAYEGNFVDSSFQGKGKYIYANGDVYVGEFEYGLAHGNGIRTYAKPKKNIAEQSGKWKYGQFQDPEIKKRKERSKVWAESLLYVEQERLDRALALIKSGQNNKRDLFFIGVGGDGSQRVFKREVEFTANKINNIYANSDFSLQLVNTYVENTDHPLATRISLEKALGHVAGKMELDQDVLMLYITSHGSDKFSITLNQPAINLPDIKALELKEMLDKTKIKWKIIIVSACYSGGFINIFKDDYTLVITASDSKSKSFGCSDEADLTWFAKAFVRDSLQPGVSYSDAFNNAKDLIKEWENKEGHKKSSNPQISMGSALAGYLLSDRVLSNSGDDWPAKVNSSVECNKGEGPGTMPEKSLCDQTK